MTFKGIDLSGLISVVIALVGALLAKFTAKLATANAKQAAWAQLANLGLAIVRDLWDDLSREFQARIADGEIDANDKIFFREMLAAKIEVYTSKAELEKIAKAVGLPLPGVIAWLAEYMIDRLVKSFDTNAPEVADSFVVKDEPDMTGG